MTSSGAAARGASGAGRPPIRVAVIGGGCGAISTAFELSRPEHRGRYEVTVYQLGWRLGGKGASGRRAPSQRIEEHGLHVWLGYYENAFRLLRECYQELGREPGSCPIIDCFDAFQPEHLISLAEQTPGHAWRLWSATFPATEERPGDPFGKRHPFTLPHYLERSFELLKALLASARTGEPASAPPEWGDTPNSTGPSMAAGLGALPRILRMGQLLTFAGLLEALSVLERVIGEESEHVVGQLVDIISMSLRSVLETWLENDQEMARVWVLVDLVLTFIRGYSRFNLGTDPRGLDALDDFDCCEWLLLNGASQTTVESTFVRSLYDLGFSYEDGDPEKPKVSAGQGLRGALRMFFTYRGAVFWKMRAGMGDVVFAPFYEVLAQRGVRFEFFHRLEHLGLCPEDQLAPGERPYVDRLVFDVQVPLANGVETYRPLVEVDGLPCWPAEPLWEQLEGGEELRRRGVDFENHWETHRGGPKTLKVNKDFDCVVLGVGLGAIPHLCGDILARDSRWRSMVDHVATVATQAFQLWLDVDLPQLGWPHGPATLSGFVEPFDTWADMRQLLWTEKWPGRDPKSIAYFCNVLPTPEGIPDRGMSAYPPKVAARVRANAVRFMNRDLHHLWPRCRDGQGFRWEWLTTDGAPTSPPDEGRFDTQFWTANVNPSDRYVLSLPGTSRFRISPLDNTYDNLTLAGDWTHCGHNHGCVEAAMMSGRLAAHAISGLPKLEDIIGYDHP